MISANAKYWIMLTQALGYNTPKVKRLAELYPDISYFFDHLEYEGRICGCLNSSELDRLRRVSPANALRVLDRCLSLQYSVLTLDDPAYPRCLYNIYAPPAVIYISGNLPDVDNRFSVAIVGTRRASRYGLENSFQFGYSLAKCGAVVVSGGALGIDCASHRGALAANGVNICVRGCGINSPYLRDNAEMRRAITLKGAVISEYPPDEEPRTFYFPARNRIIAALSDGVLIIESGKKSGSLITANLALEMGKDLFALLGNNSPQNEGSNARIKEGTAIPVTDYTDILANYDNLEIAPEDSDTEGIPLSEIEAIPVKGVRHAPVSAQPSPATPKPAESLQEATPAHNSEIQLTGDAKKVYEALSAEPVYIDILADSVGLSVPKALIALTMLEMQGLVRALPGSHYVLK